MTSKNNILDDSAISGQYLFPQPRFVAEPFTVKVDNVELACYRRSVDPAAMTIVYFHGNGEAVADYVPDMADAFSQLGLNSLFVEYREYGASTGKAQLHAMLGDGAAALEAAGVEPEMAIALGRSIGSLYAIELAQREPTLAGLIIESGIADPAERFLTYADLSAAGFSASEVHAEVEKHFNHREKLSGYQGPCLILHTENDGLIDISHAERNFQWAATTQKELVRFPNGNHNTILGVNWSEYMSAIKRFVESISALDL